jgi:hypothetical protein
LRYIPSPNQTISDSKNHAPGIDNNGPFLSMTPFSSRCCQHNHAQGWPYYSEHLMLATPDNGVAAAIYSACEATLKVADGKEITIVETTNYPFEESITFTVKMKGKVQFPFYLRIPSWTNGAEVLINGKKASVTPVQGKYYCIDRTWKNGDKVTLNVPMHLRMRTWQVNKNSVSVDHGPLTYSLRIEEKYVKRSSTETAIGDSRWQANADASKWPTTEIYAGSDWNYALVLDKDDVLKNFKVVRKPWPADNFPFILESVPVEIHTVGRKVPSWGFDEYGLTAVLPEENAAKGEKEQITLVPMGAARLRISAFPNTKE